MAAPSMFEEQDAPARPANAPHLPHRLAGSGNAHVANVDAAASNVPSRSVGPGQKKNRTPNCEWNGKPTRPLLLS